jgi:N-methylhydantoinase A/oxoprolinase/acetone carboxylase beta subunit
LAKRTDEEGDNMIRLGVDIGGTFTDFALLDTGRERSARMILRAQCLKVLLR